MAWLWLLAALAATGCYRGGAVRADPSLLRADRDWVLVEAPQVLQTGERDCGAAAAAMLLGFWGLPTDQAAIRAASAQANDQALSAGFLRAYLRSRGLEVFLIEGTLADLERELAAGRPVLAGVVKPYLTTSYAHYLLVVGVNRSARQLAVIDPADGFRAYPFAAFEQEWSPANKLLLVATLPSRPAAPPAADGRGPR